ncbi:MAG TPA: GTPase ObgE [Nitriliruptorales bacterium]|nr:GTPase ObgE [Nitriliruptorales bacterium]
MTEVRDGAPTFVDECTVHVQGGDGGNGAVAFRREAHVPRGGPSGGDGGRGGDVVLVASADVTSLLALHREPHRRAGRGGHGQGMDRTGADGADLEVAVPVGTVVRERDTGRLVADLARVGQGLVAARGGRGGRGNAAFATNRRRAPRFAERGERGQERSLRLELKLIADVGLVGFPSAGKSSLVARLSAARPRVEAWPFTTLTPHLGVMRAGDVDVVLADVPGLIEGASEGRGLGHRFLRHVERAAVLLHVLDTQPFDPARDPLSDLAVVLGELEAHDPALLERPGLVALNKVDLPDGRAMAELVRPELERRSHEVLAVSAVSGEGLDALRWRLAALVSERRAADEPVPAEEPLVVRLEDDEDAFSVARDEDGRFVVSGRRVERWVQMTPLDNAEALRYLQGRLRRAGVEQALVAAGARHADEVLIGGETFEFVPEPQDLPDDEREAMLAGEADTTDEETSGDGQVAPTEDGGG